MTFERFAEFIDRYRLGRDKFEKWANATEDYFEDCRPFLLDFFFCFFRNAGYS